MNYKIAHAALKTALLVSFLFTACSKDKGNDYSNGDDSGSQSDPNSVSIRSSNFSPSKLTIAQGVTVTWTNRDYTAHTVTADDNSFNSGTLEQGASFKHKFTEAGTVTYHCNFHTSMTGSVVIQ